MRLNIRTLNSYSYYSIIKDYTNLDGKRSTKIFEKLGNQQQVEERFGNTNTIDNIKQYVSSLNDKDKEEILKREFNPNKRIPSDIKREFDIGHLFLKDIYFKLGLNNICETISNKYKFEFNLNDIFSYLIYGRIIYPSSKLKTHKLSKNFLTAPDIKLHNIYRGLTYLNKEMDYIQEKVFENSLKTLNRNSRVIYFDCTNYYFEIDDEDEFRKYGINKQHQPKPQVGMGLFMDGDGIPLAMNLFPGNENETKNFLPTENKIIDKFKLKDTRLIVCTDAGLCTDEIKNYNIKDGRGFVITQSLKKLKEDYRKEALKETDFRISGDLRNTYNIKEIENDEVLYKKYHDTLFYKIIETETASVKQDLIVTFSFKYKEYYRELRRDQIERANKKINENSKGDKIKLNHNQNDYRRFINETPLSKDNKKLDSYEYSINEELILDEQKYDGYYALTTNLNDDIETILKVSKGRWEIEESFRIMKHDFLARPVELTREDRIKAHFLSCFIALLIYRILEHKLNYKYTTSEILDTLRDMKVLELKGDGYIPTYERTGITDDLHDAFNFNTDYEIISYKKIKNILNYKL